eukprot:Unigene103_Nuclearia_a/m.327 Unigene103_Nuclearia_a/g.327  ORF Unigene103_Nuclearia_a/g.327 Unigene103_Nuclearia_a/m.327 type:complete len:184 (-) Unigene103_Nuclearia_a:409-960(-)
MEVIQRLMVRSGTDEFSKMSDKMGVQAKDTLANVNKRLAEQGQRLTEQHKELADRLNDLTQQHKPLQSPHTSSEEREATSSSQLSERADSDGDAEPADERPRKLDLVEPRVLVLAEHTVRYGRQLARMVRARHQRHSCQREAGEAAREAGHGMPAPAARPSVPSHRGRACAAQRRRAPREQHR